MPSSSSEHAPTTATPPPKRGRGRPRNPEPSIKLNLFVSPHLAGRLDAGVRRHRSSRLNTEPTLSERVRAYLNVGLALEEALIEVVPVAEQSKLLTPELIRAVLREILAKASGASPAATTQPQLPFGGGHEVTR